MTAVILLSDDELHDELLQHGITTPVTATTRSLLRKKLELARKGRSSKKMRAARQLHTPRSLQAFSSEEEEEEEEEEEHEPEEADNDIDAEDDEEVDLISNRSSPSRGTNKSGLFRYSTDVVTRHSTPPRASTPSSGRNTTPASLKRSWSRPSLRQRAGLGVEYDSASDVEDAPLKASRPRHLSDTLEDSGLTPDLSYGRRAGRHAGQAPDLDYRTSSYRHPDGGYENGVYGGHGSGDHVSAGGRNTTAFSLLRPASWPCLSYFYSHKAKTSTKPEGSWSGGGRGSGGRVAPVSSSYFPASPPPSPSPSFFPHAPEREERERAWCPSVSTVLLLLLTLFFVLLGMTYVRLVPPSAGLIEASVGDDATTASAWEQFAGQQLEENGLKLSICPLPGSGAPPDSASPPLCLGPAEVVVAQQVLEAGREVVVEAERRHADYQCGGSQVAHLTLHELQRALAGRTGLKEEDLQLGVSVLAKLTALNPSLGLEPVLTPSRGGASEADWGGSALQGLRVRAPRLQLLCALMNIASLALAAAALTALGCGVFCLVVWVVRRLQRRRQCHQQQVYALVRKVVRAVGERPGRYAALQHVRDDLLSPEQRLALGGVWRDAVAFIDRHESRLVREVRLVGGEECEVWRWIGGDSSQPNSADDVTDASDQSRGHAASVPEERPPAPSIYPKLPAVEDDPNDSKISGRWWRGVGEQEAAVCPPTPCLKIRNLARLHRPASWVREAVLRKCRGLPVLHLAVDQHGPEGLVYLMAASVQAAGEIHSLLHGQWFEGELVSVKFLRRERYCERFPAAPHCTTPLSPTQ